MQTKPNYSVSVVIISLSWGAPRGSSRFSSLGAVHEENETKKNNGSLYSWRATVGLLAENKSVRESGCRIGTSHKLSRLIFAW